MYMQFPEDIIRLIEKYQAGTITADEKLILDDWYNSFDDSKAELITHINITEQLLGDRIKNRLLETVHHVDRLPVIRHRRIWQVTAAASILLLFSIGIYFILPSKSPKQLIVKTTSPPKKLKNDIPPGSNKAVLTLADGSTIVLDSASNGIISTQGNIKVQKLNNGLLAYSINGKQVTENDEAFFNVISTPRGGQYQVTLSDGTKVWLNAASSIRFPVTFSSAERRVEISGEAYFEVAHLSSSVNKKAVPFIVKIKSPLESDWQIKVLGTHFNVNAYEEESEIRTTLLEGKVKVIKDNSGALLLPGQQAQINKGSLTVSDDADLEEVLAWKEGLFIMKKAGIGNIMRQIARWYDVEIVYQGSIPSGRISGDIPRNMNLSKVLEVMELSGVHFRIEGKKVIVKP